MVKKRSRARLILAFTTVFLTIVGAVLLIANLTGSAKLVSVMSDSMSPAIPKGSLVVAQSTPVKEVREGDIIVLGLDSVTETKLSRISSIRSDNKVYSYTLWSDNAQLQNEWLHRTSGNLNVVIWSYPMLGWVFFVLSNPFFITAMLAGSIWFAYYYVMKLFEFNKRQVHARRIAEERLERIKYGGIEDLVELFEPLGGMYVKIGKDRAVKIENLEDLDTRTAEYEQKVERREAEKLQRKNRSKDVEVNIDQ